MRRVLLIQAALTAALLLPASAGAQEGVLASMMREDPIMACVNSRPYDFLPVSDTPAPRGFKPVYISHYGRHGSRTGWGSSDYRGVIDALEAAEKAGILSASGDTLLDAARRCLEIYDGMDGRLLPLGVSEHRQLAKRMYGRYANVFKGEKVVRSMSSLVPRSIISMNAFTAQLTAMNPKLVLKPDTGEKFTKYMNSVGPDSLVRGAREVYEKVYQELPEDTVSIRSLLFTDVEKSRSVVSNVHNLQTHIYGVACTAPCMEVGGNLFRFLPFDAVYRRTACTNAKIYLRYGNCKGYGEKRISYAEPLVEDIVSKADEALSAGNVAADLRFGHDWVILECICRLGLEGAAPYLAPDEINARWCAGRYLCMASNLQLIFYRNRAGEVLVKFLYQEQECRLRGLEPVSGPYYRWEDVKNNLKKNER